MGWKGLIYATCLGDSCQQWHSIPTHTPLRTDRWTDGARAELSQQRGDQVSNTVVFYCFFLSVYDILTKFKATFLLLISVSTALQKLQL